MSAFYYCTDLTSVIIGNSVTTIGNSAFLSCYNLNSIICEAVTPPVIDENTFLYVSKYIPVYVPCNSFNAYKTTNYWNEFNYFNGMNDTVFIFDTICQGGVYNGNGFIINDGDGIYYRTQTSVNNCSSVICLTLSEYPQSLITYYSASICPGGIYSDDNFTDLRQTGDYYDTLQNINGCDSIICLTLTAYPRSLITYYSTSICQGDIYSDDNFTNLTQAGNYYDTLQNINGCDSIIELTLIVNSLPDIPIISQNGNELMSSEANSYQWYLDNQPVDGATQQNYIYTQNGIYFVEVTNEHGCKIKSDSINITNVWIAGISEENSSIIVYPNPTKGQLKIDNGQLKIDNIEIFDVMGRNVYSSTRPLVHSSTIIIDISHFQSGVYLLKIMTEHGIITQKGIKN
jgi:hypothetical protein